MKSYRYELIVYVNNIQIKRFIGNDINILKERFEQWVIKSPQDRNEMNIYIGEIQHAGY